MIKLDLSKFKHVSSNDKTTTLKHHKDGHQITLVHKSLNPENQKQLEALSKIAAQDRTPEEQDAAKHGGYAKGGNVYDKNVKGVAQHHHNGPNGESARGYAVRESTKTESPKAKHQYMENAKEDSKEKLEDSKKIQPNIQGLADGGQVDRTKQVAGGTVKGAAGADITKPSTWFAEGGRVEKFCAYCGDQKHEGDCKGGEVQKLAHGSKDIDYVSAPTADDQYDPTLASDSQTSDNTSKLPGDEGYDSSKTNFEKAKNWVSKNMFPHSEADSQVQQPAQQAPVQQPAPEVAPQQPQAPMQPPQQAQPEAEEEQPQAAPQPKPMASAPKQAPQASAPQEEQAQTASPAPKTYADHVMDTKQDILQEAQHWQHDLDNGHITPKTYNDLFHDRGTLGKIGMIFGMLGAGMGSGLTHQPNAMLEMMNKQIDNDLQAQKQSKDNAINYLKLNQQDAMNKAQIGQLGHQAKLTDAQAKALNIESEAKARVMMQRAALHDLVTKTQALPPGSPQRQAAEQQLAMINNSIQSDNYNIADRAASGAAYYKTLFGQQQQGLQGPAADQEEAFKQQNNALRTLGDMGSKKAEYNEQHHIPGYQQLASRPVPEDTQKQILAMNVLDNKAKDLIGFAKQHAGTWNPQTKAVAQQKVEEMKNFYNDSIKGGALTEGRLGWYDEQFKKNPTDILPQILGSTKKLEEMANSNANRRDMLVKSVGIDPNSHYNNQQSQQPQQQANQPVKGKDGRMYIRQGNYMVPVK